MTNQTGKILAKPFAFFFQKYWSPNSTISSKFLDTDPEEDSAVQHQGKERNSIIIVVKIFIRIAPLPILKTGSNFDSGSCLLQNPLPILTWKYRLKKKKFVDQTYSLFLCSQKPFSYHHELVYLSHFVLTDFELLHFL